MLIKHLWTDIEAWLHEHAPNLRDDLHPGASEARIMQFEDVVGRRLPDDFRMSLETHDGAGGHFTFGGAHTFLDLDGSLSWWQVWQQHEQDRLFDGWTVEGEGFGRIQSIYWHSAWIPFAADSVGNLLCIDLEPAEQGSYGQITALESQDRQGPYPTDHVSFAAFLRRFRDDLHRGAYQVDEDGFLEERDIPLRYHVTDQGHLTRYRVGFDGGLTEDGRLGRIDPDPDGRWLGKTRGEDGFLVELN